MVESNYQQVGSLRSFGRRRGRKLRDHAQGLFSSLLPEISVSLLYQPPENQELWLEIGFGGGEHLAHIAATHPKVMMLGCEPYVNGIAGLLGKIESDKLSNIRVYDDDVRLLLESMPDESLSRVYILYPDPWPKARHNKRRLIQKNLLDALARVMKPEATLYIATDWADYATWILEQLLPHPDFSWQAQQASDFEQPWEGWIPTRYEQKARREGRSSSYLVFARVKEACRSAA